MHHKEDMLDKQGRDNRRSDVVDRFAGKTQAGEKSTSPAEAKTISGLL